MSPSLRRCLDEPVFDLWWTWSPDIIEILRAMDGDAWRDTGHNDRRATW